MNLAVFDAFWRQIDKWEAENGLPKGTISQTIEEAEKAGWKTEEFSPPSAEIKDGDRTLGTAFFFSSDAMRERKIKEYYQAKKFLESRK